MELTTGLHGYLHFGSGAPYVAYNVRDADQETFVHEATRYYQIYDADDLPAPPAGKNGSTYARTCSLILLAHVMKF
jgi:hypothetical protein